MEKQLEMPRMSCVVVVVDAVGGAGDGCHSGFWELKWQKVRRVESNPVYSLGCLPHLPCPLMRGHPYHFCKG